MHNINNCTGEVRQKLRDYLDRKNVECGKGSGESISTKLGHIPQPSSTSEQSRSLSHDTAYNQFETGNTGKRNILKPPRKSETLFTGPYEVLILSSNKRQFLKDCNAFEVLEN